MAVATIIALAMYIVLDALYDAIHKIWYSEFPKCNCVKNIRSRVENCTEQLSKVSYYEMIDYDAHEPLDAQVVEARSKHRFEFVSRAVHALLDRIAAFDRGQDDTVPCPHEAISWHASTLITVKSPGISYFDQMAWMNGLIGLLIGLLIVELSR